MKVYTLIENNKRKNTAFMGEHGLSLYFEHGGKRILFDTGASDNFIYNATLLGIDLARVDICVLSHSHYDHTGGLAHFLDINKKAKVYMKSAATRKLYTKRLVRKIYSGMSEGFFEKYGDRITFVDEDEEIAKGVFIANIDKFRHYPRYASIMYSEVDGKIVRDDLSHELFITIKTDEGSVVLTGCAHNGLINILETAKAKFGQVYAVIGGFHLDGTKKYGIRVKREPHMEIRAIAKYFNKNNISKVYTGHCTGEKPLEKLALISRTKKIHAGDIINI